MVDYTENTRVLDPHAVDPILREAVVYYEFTRRNLSLAQPDMVATLHRLNVEAAAALVRLLSTRGGAVIVDGYRYSVDGTDLYRQEFIAPYRKPHRVTED